MNKTVKSVLFAAGVVAVLALTVLFGYLGFKGEKPLDKMNLSYTDKVTMVNGTPEVVHSGVEFKNGDSTKCKMQLTMGDPSEKYSFLTIVKILAPSGKATAWVSGSSGSWEMEFDLPEKGTYTITSEYYADAYSFRDACLELDPNTEIKIEDDGSFDGFVFSGEDGQWKIDHDIKINTSK